MSISFDIAHFNFDKTSKKGFYHSPLQNFFIESGCNKGPGSHSNKIEKNIERFLKTSVFVRIHETRGYQIRKVALFHGPLGR